MDIKKITVQFLTPKTIWDKLGAILLVWIATPAFIEFINVGSYLNRDYFYILAIFLSAPLTAIGWISSLMFPSQSEGLGIVGVLMLTIPIIILLINIILILLGYFFSKRLSFFLPILTLLLTLILVVGSYLGTYAREINQTNQNKNSDLLAEDINISVSDCEILNTSANYNSYPDRSISCELTLDNIPASISEDLLAKNFTIYLNFGSREYEAFTPDELERNSNIPGTNKEYHYDKLNHVFESYGIYGSDPAILDVSDDTVVLKFEIGVPDEISLESVYISEFSIGNIDYMQNMKTFRSTDVELLLLK